MESSSNYLYEFFVSWFYYSKNPGFICDNLPISELYDWECSFLEKSQNCQMFKNHKHACVYKRFFRANITQWVKTFLKSQLISIVQTIVYSQKTIVLSHETIFRIPWTMGTIVESSEDIVYNP